MMAGMFDALLGAMRSKASGKEIADGIEGAGASDLLRIQPSVSGARTGMAPMYFRRFLHELPQALAPTGVGNTPNGDARWQVTMTAGSNVLTYTGGTAIADAGTAGWMGVLIVGDTYTIVNVLGTSGNSITLAQTMSASGAAVLASYHDAYNGQHIGPAGGYALADLMLSATPHELVSGQSMVDMDSERGAWYVETWQSPNFSPDYWRQYGGLVGGNLILRYIENNFDTPAKIGYAFTTKMVSLSTSAAGQGANCFVTTGGASGVISLVVGVGLAAAVVPTDVCAVTVLADGVQIYQQQTGPALRRLVIPFGNCQQLEIRVTAVNATPTRIRIGRLMVMAEAQNYSRIVEQGDVILPIGDSWLDEVARPWLLERLRVKAALRGAKVLPSMGVGGTQASYALAVVNGVRRIDAWIAANPGANKAIIHYYINDYNAGVGAATWAANLAEIGRTLISAGITPVFVLPGCTASPAQTQGMMASYGNAFGWASQTVNRHSRATPTELSGAVMFVNTVGKFAGRAVNVPGVGTYIARGGAATDPWDCITSGATPATVTPA